MELYIIFSLATALMAMVKLFRPSINAIKKAQPLNKVVNSKLSYFLFFLFSFLLAPLMFLVVIIPHMSDIFVESITESYKTEK